MSRNQLVAAAALAALGSVAQAADFSFTGSFGRDDDVQLFGFSVGATSSVTFRTWSYAGGVNAAGQTIPRGGFDPILAVFDASGALLGQNDDGIGVPPDAGTGAPFDTLLTLLLDPGSYRVAVMQFDNFAVGPNLSNGFSFPNDPAFTSRFGCAARAFCDVTGDSRTGNWAFDILNVDDATTTVVPVPAALPLMLGGIALLGWGARRRAAVA